MAEIPEHVTQLRRRWRLRDNVRFVPQNFSRRPGGSQMIRKAIEQTLHSGRSFQGP